MHYTHTDAIATGYKLGAMIVNICYLLMICFSFFGLLLENVFFPTTPVSGPVQVRVTLRILQRRLGLKTRIIDPAGAEKKVWYLLAVSIHEWQAEWRATDGHTPGWGGRTDSIDRRAVKIAQLDHFGPQCMVSLHEAWEQAVREAAQCAPTPVRHTLRPSSSPYTPYACGAQRALLPVAVGAMNIHYVRDIQTSGSIIALCPRLGAGA